jgi:hypothetical protein
VNPQVLIEAEFRGEDRRRPAATTRLRLVLLRPLPVATVALSFRSDALSLAPTILRQRASEVVAFSELTFAVAPRITLVVGLRLHQFASRQ